MKKFSGFTLIELMITLFIVGILLAVGVPSMKTFMQSNQLVASTNELISALHVARSEAIKLNARVSICESSDGKTCDTTGSWKEGWIVFVDTNGDLANTGAPCAAPNTDCLLRIHDGFTDNQLTVAGVDANAAAINSFTFTSRGLPKAVNGAPQSGVFSICSLDSGGNTIGSRAVVLSLFGRVRVSDNPAVMSCP
ncbi:MAG: GspH/FimT family pseudopilin [Gammaproteobacteria bacterium]|nr:GspH/FimT family pseudopilin [Gammaproteobacteria bacterium]NNJ50005.1 prepilin-type N-terminal cleavage/methylation domain-containing protein [Gammaproteobacteria bacterium]